MWRPHGVSLPVRWFSTGIRAGKHARTPLRHRLSHPTPWRRTSSHEEARPGELPALEFAQALVPAETKTQFTSPPLSHGLLRMVHGILGERARPTTPQAQSLAHFFSPRHGTARHTLIAAETGSGKTLAYLLPVLQRLHQSRSHTEHADIRHVQGGFEPCIMPRALVLAPTHELARQISEVAKVLCHDASHKLRVACSSKPAFSTTLQADLARLARLASSSETWNGAPISPDVLVSTPSFVAEHKMLLSLIHI